MPPARIERSVEITASAEAAYLQWSRCENFPKFMRGVEEVRKIAPNRLLWKADLWGETAEWEAEITAEIPNQLIAWKCVSDEPGVQGSVSFTALEGGRSLVTLALTFEASEDPGELASMAKRVQDDLESFRLFLERR
jgi:uncharacterized membrane protein